ncbi:T9SS type A sorting domain-containing protein [candidate division KSB1 bacterium]
MNAGIDGDPTSGDGGFPYTMKPDSFYCWAKLGIQPQDTGIFLIIFKKNSYIISENIFQFKGNNPNQWVKLGFKLDPLPVNPDSVVIAAASSNAINEIGITPGSFIILDDLFFNTSQPIINGDFEDWSVHNLDIPQGWNSNNMQSIVWGNQKQIEKTTDAYKGNFALKMKTNYLTDFNWFMSILGNGYPSNNHNYGAFPFTMQNDTLFGWYKYLPKPGDTAVGAINVWKSTNPSFSEQRGIMLLQANSWTKFEIVINAPGIPDSAELIFSSSLFPVEISDTGSILYLDEIQFSSAPLNTGLQEIISEKEISCYPNPSTGIFNIKYPVNEISNADFALTDCMGRLLFKGKLINETTIIDLSSFSKGVYFIRMQGNNSITRRLIIE